MSLLSLLLWLLVDYYYESAVCFMQRLLFRSLRFFRCPSLFIFLLFFFFFELFNCFCFLACNLMPRFYLFHFPAAAAPHCTLSLSLSVFLSILYLLPIVVCWDWDYTILIYTWCSLQVSWYQNSFPIQTTDRRIMNTRANRHTLTIRHIQQEDFGNYR